MKPSPILDDAVATPHGVPAPDLFDAVPVGLLLESPGGRVTRCNQALLEILGHDSMSAVQGRATSAVLQGVDDTEATIEFVEADDAARVLPSRREIRLRRADGDEVWVRVERSEVAGGGTLYVVMDITALKQREIDLEVLAYHDPLTGLPNRRLLKARAEQTLALAGRKGERLALIFLDLVDFKQVNDRMGHGTGDELLVHLARRMEEALRAADTAARMGGDEFAVLLTEVGDPAAARTAAERLMGHLEAPVFVDDRSMRVQVRAGLALFPDHGRTLSALLAGADQALGRGKKQQGSVLYFAEGPFAPSRRAD